MLTQTLDGESWTIQCEVMLQHPNMHEPPVEDPIPEDIDTKDAVPFDFFGLGQPVNGPNLQEDQEQEDAWDQWPTQIQAQDQPMQQAQSPIQIQNLNELPNMEDPIGLNQPPPLNLDLHPVIINPVVQPQGDELIDLNEQQHNVMEQHLLQLENEVYMANPIEEGLMQAAVEQQQEGQQELLLNVPALPHSPVNLQVDEIPLDQLIEPGEEEFPEAKHALAEPFLAGQLMQNQQEADQYIQNQQNEVEPDEPLEQNIPNEGAVQQAMMIDEVQLHPSNQHNNNIQIGMALMRMEELNPVWNRAKDAEATRLWAKYFSGTNHALQVQIPSS